MDSTPETPPQQMIKTPPLKVGVIRIEMESSYRRHSPPLSPRCP